MNKQLFIVKEKKALCPSGCSVPRHEELVFLRKLSDNSWNARNTETREVVVVERKDDGEFVLFEITAIT